MGDCWNIETKTNHEVKRAKWANLQKNISENKKGVYRNKFLTFKNRDGSVK